MVARPGVEPLAAGQALGAKRLTQRKLPDRYGGAVHEPLEARDDSAGCTPTLVHRCALGA